MPPALTKSLERMRAGQVSCQYGRAGPPASLSSGVRLTRPTTMFTIFHLIELMGAVFGIVAGALVGRGWLGWIGLVLGGVVGLFVGGILGKLPYAIAGEMLKRNLKRCDVPTLRSRLEREYYISHLIIAQLLIRGEPIESFKDYVAGLRHSDSPDRRRFGEQLLRIWPETALPADAPPTQKGEAT
jgi:hypothetical protein